MFTRYALTDSVERYVNGDKLTFSGISTGYREFNITVNLSDANSWVNGELIQNCFPYLSADEREVLMTGIDKETWDGMFSESEDDE